MSNKNKKTAAPAASASEAAVIEAPVAVVETIVDAPIEAVQESIAAEAVTSETAPAEAVVVVEKKPKNKPNETTRTIEKFADDTKGIRAGMTVSFKESNKPDAKTVTGKVQRIFDFYLKPERQEAKIQTTIGKNRCYRFEKDLTVVVETPAETAPVVAEVNETVAEA